jgi:hypothetical protein
MDGQVGHQWEFDPGEPVMNANTFESNPGDLDRLLGNVASGEIQLPDFQRGWVWDDDRIRNLIASVSRSFPIGTVMLLETGGDVNFRTRPIEGATPEVDVPGLLLLDGQQRMTSLFRALMTSDAVKTKNTKNKTIYRHYYVDIRQALDEHADREDAIISVPETKQLTSDFGRQIDLDLTSPTGEYANLLFPLSKVFAHYEWAREFREHFDYDGELSALWDDFDRDVLGAFRSYKLPVIKLGKSTPKEAVCIVFEKVNTGGVALTVFELLTATFAAVAPPDFELRQDWADRRRRLSAYTVLSEVQATDFIQAVTLLATREQRLQEQESGRESERLRPVSCKRSEMLRLTFEEYTAWADKVEAGFIEAAKFLHREHVYDVKFLPYGAQLIPLAAIHVVLGNAAENQSVRDRLARWYWCGVFGELYGSTTETRFARDLVQVVEWATGASEIEPSTVVDANFAPDRLLTLRTRRSAAYRGIYVLLLREGAKDFRTGQTWSDQTYFDEAVDIHHVFPQKWCRERSPSPVDPRIVDSVVNKTPLTARTNRIIGGVAPSAYLGHLERKHDVPTQTLNDNLSSHFVSAELARADNFEGFFNHRRDLLLGAIAAATGKPILGNVDPLTSSTVVNLDDEAEDLEDGD